MITTRSTLRAELCTVEFKSSHDGRARMTLQLVKSKRDKTEELIMVELEVPRDMVGSTVSAFRNFINREHADVMEIVRYIGGPRE